MMRLLFVLVVSLTATLAASPASAKGCLRAPSSEALRATMQAIMGPSAQQRDV